MTARYTDRHHELLIEVTLMRRDQLEYRKEHAKEKVETLGLLTSTRLDNDDSDSDDIDFNKSMKAESEKRAPRFTQIILYQIFKDQTCATQGHNCSCQNNR